MIRLAVDASNFVQDQRGMGRIARPVVRAALEDPRFAVSLLAQRRDAPTLRRMFGEQAHVQNPATAEGHSKYDVVWFPFNGMRYVCKAPTAVTICDMFAFTEPAGGLIARWREQQPIRRSTRRATRIVTISRWSAHQIAVVLRVDPKRITIIHPAPDPFFFPASGDALPPHLEGKRYVLFIGGREARKNVPLFLEACAKALQAPGEVLAVVGSLDDRDEERLRTYGVPHVRLHADDTLLRTLYRNATLVAVPSRSEGFGLTAVEAMACGACVIAADAAALPEAAAGNALLVDPNDVKAWETALRSLLDDSQQRLALAARATAQYAFSDRRKPVREMLTLLRQTAEHGSG